MLKKGDIVQFTRHYKTITKDTYARVVRGGKKTTIHYNLDAKTGRIMELQVPPAFIDAYFKKSSFQSRVAVLNEIDFSKVKHHAAMSHETMALSGHIIYKGVKIGLHNEGFGGDTSFDHSQSELLDEINQRIRDETLAINPDATDFLLNLEFAVNWSIEVVGLADFPEYAAV